MSHCNSGAAEPNRNLEDTNRKLQGALITHVNGSSVCKTAQVKKVIAAVLAKGGNIQLIFGLKARPTSNRSRRVFDECNPLVPPSKAPNPSKTKSKDTSVVLDDDGSTRFPIGTKTHKLCGKQECEGKITHCDAVHKPHKVVCNDGDEEEPWHAEIQSHLNPSESHKQRKKHHLNWIITEPAPTELDEDVHGADVIEPCAHAAATGIKTHLACDDAHRDLACKLPGNKVPKGNAIEVLQSSQGHPLLEKEWMKMVDDILVNELRFRSATHDGCTHKKVAKQGKTTFLLRQVDDSLIAAKSQATAESTTKQTREHVKFAHEKELPIALMCTVEDHNGGNASQFKDSILLSSKSHIERMLKTHGWERKSPDVKPACKDGETDGHLVSPLPADCLSELFNETGPKEGTAEFVTLEKKQNLQSGFLLGKLMRAVATTRPDTSVAANSTNCQ